MKKTVIIILIVSQVFGNTVFGQLETKWSNNFGGLATERAFRMIQYNDTYFVTGLTCSDNFQGTELMSGNNGCDIVLLNLSKEGQFNWVKKYGGSESENGEDMCPTNDGGLIIVGNSESQDIDLTTNYGQSDIWVVKLNQNFDIEWQNSFGDNLWDYAKSVIQNSDGDFLVLSQTQDAVTFDSNLSLIKLSSTGNTIWNKNYGGSSNEDPGSIIQTLDGGYLITSSSESADNDVQNNYGELDYWILKLDPNGNIIWEKNFGGSLSDIAESSIELDNEDLIIIGRSNSNDLDVEFNNGNSDYWIVKLTKNGELQWGKNFGGSGEDLPREVAITLENKLMISGTTTSDDIDVINNQGATDGWILIIDQNGNLESSKTFGGTMNDIILSAIPNENGNFLFAGSSNSNDFDLSDNYGFHDIWIAEIGLTSNTEETFHENELKIFPNPNNGSFTTILDTNTNKYQIEIFDQLGKPIIKRKIENNHHWNSDLPNGIYTITITTAKKAYSQKIIIHR